jgi:hypothetical protein
MKTLRRLLKIISHPRETSREIIHDQHVDSSLSVVLGFGIILSLMFLISHLKADYPPPAKELQVWIETWGEFPILPFVRIPAEKYRLAQAVFVTPLMIAVWILMAGSAKLLSILFGGNVSYKQYLNLFGFSFYAFWIVASIFDTIYSGIFGDLVYIALKMENGAIAKTIVAFFPSVMWTILLGFGGVYNAIVTHESERFSLCKTAIVGIVTFAWPILLISLLIR